MIKMLKENFIISQQQKCKGYLRKIFFEILIFFKIETIFKDLAASFNNVVNFKKNIIISLHKMVIYNYEYSVKTFS